MKKGACYRSTESVDLWFPSIGQNCHKAKAICAMCPVKRGCLEYALTHDIRYGVWGGTSPRERQRILARAA